jgi:hypothetical protein
MREIEMITDEYDAPEEKPTQKKKETSEYPTEAEWIEKQNSEPKPQIDTSQFKEITLTDIGNVLSLTIKDDDSNKKIVFLGMLSAYTKQSQINISLNAPSSTGKTYIVKEVAGLFPKIDKIEIHAATPTSFFYEVDYFDKARNARFKDVRRKILIFYELPDPTLQIKLRPLLSHDNEEIFHKQTNKNKGRNVTETTIVKGYAAFLFCSANMKLDEQEATRSMLLSPQVTAAKLSQSIHLRAMRGSNEQKFYDWLETNPERIELKNRIIAIRDEHVDDIIINEPESIEERFLELAGALQPRHQRDIDHLFELIRTVALLNVWFRRQKNGTVVASQSDINQAFELFNEFFESQGLNLPPAVHSFYKKYIVPAYIKLRDKYKISVSYLSDFDNQRIGLTLQDLTTYYLNAESTSLNGETLRKDILPQLENAGLIIWDKPSDYNADKRSRHIFPQLFTTEEEKLLNYIGNEGESDEDIGEVNERLDL